MPDQAILNKAVDSLEPVTLKIEGHRAQVDAATVLLEKAKAAAPRSAEQHYSVGLALYQLQDYREAVEQLSASYFIRPQAETAARIGLAAWRGNDLETAEKWTRIAVTSEPAGKLKTLTAGTTPTFQALLAQVMFSAGKLTAAQSTAESALKVDANDVTALTVLSLVQVAGGNGSHALTTLDRAHASANGALKRDLTKLSATLDRVLRDRMKIPMHVLDLGDILRQVS
jgi:tetratricopeptide (TPR) repeat protein